MKEVTVSATETYIVLNPEQCENNMSTTWMEPNRREIISSGDVILTTDVQGFSFIEDPSNREIPTITGEEVSESEDMTCMEQDIFEELVAIFKFAKELDEKSVDLFTKGPMFPERIAFKQCETRFNFISGKDFACFWISQGWFGFLMDRLEESDNYSCLCDLVIDTDSLIGNFVRYGSFKEIIKHMVYQIY